jgi:hypothetical protein
MYCVDVMPYATIGLKARRKEAYYRISFSAVARGLDLYICLPAASWTTIQLPPAAESVLCKQKEDRDRSCPVEVNGKSWLFPHDKFPILSVGFLLVPLDVRVRSTPSRDIFLELA